MAVGNKTLNRAQLVFQFTSKFIRELKILSGSVTFCPCWLKFLSVFNFENTVISVWTPLLNFLIFALQYLFEESSKFHAKPNFLHFEHISELTVFSFSRHFLTVNTVVYVHRDNAVYDICRLQTTDCRPQITDCKLKDTKNLPNKGDTIKNITLCESEKVVKLASFPRCCWLFFTDTTLYWLTQHITNCVDSLFLFDYCKLIITSSNAH